MKKLLQELWDKLYNWMSDFVLMLPNILIAILILVGSIFLARFSKKMILKVMGKMSENRAVNRLLSNLITVVVVLVGLFIALGILHLDKTVTSLLAGAGVVGLAVGLAFQDPILNIISGVVLSVKEVPFQMGDLIKTNGHYGYVKRISLRTTMLKSLSGEDVVLPNKMVVQNPITNYSFSADRRVDVGCGVTYDADLEHVMKVATDAVEANINRIKDREIEFMYTEFGDSSINFTLRYWIKETGEKDFLNSRGRAIIEIKKAFDREGISIPFPIRTLEFSQKEVLSGLKGT